jgi:SAM-dependent methyltransferase
LDYSSGMLQEAMQRAPAPYLRGDMRYLPFSPKAFDGAWVCASMLHIPRVDAPVVLAGIWRILKPGGTFYLALKEGEGEQWDFRKGERFFTFFKEDEIRLLLESAGFEIAELVINPGETALWINIFAQKISRKKPVKK